MKGVCVKKPLGWDCLTVPLFPDRFPFLLQETATQEKGSEIGQSAGAGGVFFTKFKAYPTDFPISLLLFYPVSSHFSEIFPFLRCALQIGELAVAPILIEVLLLINSDALNSTKYAAHVWVIILVGFSS